MRSDINNCIVLFTCFNRTGRLLRIVVALDKLKRRACSFEGWPTSDVRTREGGGGVGWMAYTGRRMSSIPNTN